MKVDRRNGTRNEGAFVSSSNYSRSELLSRHHSSDAWERQDAPEQFWRIHDATRRASPTDSRFDIS